jgi:acyl carrier protein
MMLLMDQAAIFKELAEILEIDADRVTAEFPLSEGKWDSVAMLSIIAMIDEHCGVTISGAQLERCVTVQDILTLAAES